MLQLALWICILGEQLPEQSIRKLASATQWLVKLADPESGGVPNLGPNDGANILPLSTCSPGDFRPTLQAASLIFQGKPAFSPGPWDDLAIWLNNNKPDSPDEAYFSSDEKKFTFPVSSSLSIASPHTIHCPDHYSWAYLRAAKFTSRPGHADQLHLDLWWRGVNVAMDAGTFSYNDPPPWNNALSSTHVHNTLTINGRDQMVRAGRFLWLDWAQAEVISHEQDSNAQFERIIARHNGYQKIGIIHQRSVTAIKGGHWNVTDSLLPIHSHSAPRKKPQDNQFLARLHWLLPDWSWQIDSEQQNTQFSLQLLSPLGILQLSLKVHSDVLLSHPEIKLIRAGEILYGSGVNEATSGWSSPTYQSRLPALSVSYQVLARIPMQLVTEWNLPGSQ
jgi:hypothetical protein